MDIHIFIYEYLLTYGWMHTYDDDDDDVYLEKLQTRGVKKPILYM
jgi:hypothetical protein